MSEVKPAVGTDSSERVPEGPQSRKWGDSSGRRGALSSKVWGGVVARENSRRLPSVVSSLTLILDARGPESSPLARPPAPASLYRVIQSYFFLYAALRVIQKDAQFGGSPARPRLLQRRGPALRPMSAQDGPTGRGRGESGGPRAPLATSTKQSGGGEAGPRPFPAWAGWATPEDGAGKNYNSRRASGRPARQPLVAITPKPRGRCIFISSPLSAWFE